VHFSSKLRRERSIHDLVGNRYLEAVVTPDAGNPVADFLCSSARGDVNFLFGPASGTFHFHDDVLLGFHRGFCSGSTDSTQASPDDRVLVLSPASTDHATPITRQTVCTISPLTSDLSVMTSQILTPSRQRLYRIGSLHASNAFPPRICSAYLSKASAKSFRSTIVVGGSLYWCRGISGTSLPSNSTIMTISLFMAPFSDCGRRAASRRCTHPLELYFTKQTGISAGY
jgi:hypothetical protein